MLCLVPPIQLTTNPVESTPMAPSCQPALISALACTKTRNRTSCVWRDTSVIPALRRRSGGRSVKSQGFLWPHKEFRTSLSYRKLSKSKTKSRRQQTSHFSRGVLVPWPFELLELCCFGVPLFLPSSKPAVLQSFCFHSSISFLCLTLSILCPSYKEVCDSMRIA